MTPRPPTPSRESATSRHRGSRRARSAVLVGVLLTALWMSGAAAFEAQAGAIFNNPKGSHAERYKIINHVNTAIRGAKAGSRILISTYLMDVKASADALIAARNRGVHVQIVMDGDDVHSAQGRRLARAMNRDNKPGKPIPVRWGHDQSFVVFCQGSCRGGEHNNHAKFYVFTHTGARSNVVMVSSSNLNRGGATLGWNDLYEADGNADMVARYAAIHAEMARDTPSGDRYQEYHVGIFTLRFYPKPKGGDPVMSDLSKVRCHGATGGAGRGGRTAINVSMFAWNNDRGTAIAKKLISLDRDGCQVSVIYGAPSRAVRDLLMGSARRGGIKLWDSRMDRNGDGVFDLRVHHKYMLINGSYGGDHSSWRVHTGSQNWGRGTLRGGDENTLTIASRGAYRQYIANWDRVAANSRRIS